MLYETLLQGKVFLVMMYFGVIAGILLTTKKVIDKSFKKNKILVAISDVILLMLYTLLFLVAKTKFCYGEFRLFEIIAFCIGIFLQQFSLNKLVEKILKVLYNMFTKIIIKLKKTKLFGKILK